MNSQFQCKDLIHSLKSPQNHRSTTKTPHTYKPFHRPRPRTLKRYKFPYSKHCAAHKHGRFTSYYPAKGKTFIEYHHSSQHTKKYPKNTSSYLPRHRKQPTFKSSKKPKESKHNIQLKQARQAKKKLENNAVRQHINYFESVPHEVIPSNLKHLIPHLLETGDYSQAFYYEDTDGAKSIIYVHSGDCTDSGRPKYVFINKYLIASDSLFKIAKLSCNDYFIMCPMAAIDRNSHILHLFGNNAADADKWISFSLKTGRVIYMGQISYNGIRISHIVNHQYCNESKENEEILRALNRVSSGIVLRDKWPQSNYKRYLFVDKLGRLLRFGGVNGVDNSVQYVDIWTLNGARIESVKWKTYDFILPGSALSMHFVIGYDYLLYVFDVKGGGNGKIWIIDLLFNGHAVFRALKSLDTWFAYDFGVKISSNYVKFINATRYGELLVSLSDIMPRSLMKYYDNKSKALVNGYCRRVSDGESLFYSFPVCLAGTVFSFYQPFF